MEFKRHAWKLPDAFQVLNNGVLESNAKTSTPTESLRRINDSFGKKTKTKNAPFCLHHKCRKMKVRHEIEDCWNTGTKEQNQALYDKLRAERAADGPANNNIS